MAAGRDVTAGEEVLTGEQRRFEALALALRTPGGVPADALPDDLDGLVDRVEGRAVLTVRGRLLANSVTSQLVAPARRPVSLTGPGSGPGSRAAGPAPAGTMPPYG
jgi:hypothetical protein